MHPLWLPLEVTPEYVSDVGTKKGEKVDYAIVKDGSPIMLFECKKSGDSLNINHAGQLFRYFHVTSVRFGVLTNGIEYKLFSDLEQRCILNPINNWASSGLARAIKMH